MNIIVNAASDETLYMGCHFSALKPTLIIHDLFCNSEQLNRKLLCI